VIGIDSNFSRVWASTKVFGRPAGVYRFGKLDAAFPAAGFLPLPNSSATTQSELDKERKPKVTAKREAIAKDEKNDR
jgi:hypothetical protein